MIYAWGLNTAICRAAFPASAADMSLDGSLEFRFVEGGRFADVADAKSKATDIMPVPGCFDAMPKWRTR
ncbi:MAG: hypothetical protein J6T01_05100 [Kiritimatiellae bacterium]|nr:hypothetical protein [Kiritimatiellia bacterium]